MNWPALFVTLAIVTAVFIPIGWEYRKLILQRRQHERECQDLLRQMEASLNKAKRALEEHYERMRPKIESLQTSGTPLNVRHLSVERARQIGEQVSVAAEQAAYETLEASRRLDAQARERANQR